MDGFMFQLTDEIIDQIIFGMENQADAYYVNLENGSVGSESLLLQGCDGVDIGSIALPVPEWYPSDGFQLMESFIVSIHNPVHRKALSDILSAGRGAFRNFKSYVKESELLTKKWYSHKERVMRAKVVEWYNSNSDILRYEDMEENTDDTEGLILTDFIFRTDCPALADVAGGKADSAIREALDSVPDFIVNYFIKKNEAFYKRQEVTALSVCTETLDGEYAGSIKGGVADSANSGLKTCIVSSIWVEKQFRGMGIARQLIDEFLKEAGRRAVDTVLFELPGGGSVLKSTLEERSASAIFTTMAVNLADV